MNYFIVISYQWKPDTLTHESSKGVLSLFPRRKYADVAYSIYLVKGSHGEYIGYVTGSGKRLF